MAISYNDWNSKYYDNADEVYRNLHKEEIDKIRQKVNEEQERQRQQREQNNNNNKWFSLPKYEINNIRDGLSAFGKTTLGTLGDIGVNAIKGFAEAGENIADLAAYGVAGVADLFGADNYANEVRKNASENFIEEKFKPLDNFVDKYSILGEKSDNVVKSIGNMYANNVVGNKILGKYSEVPVTIKGHTLNMPTTSIISGASSGMSEAYQKGGNNKQALAKGITGGLSEGISEGLFGFMEQGGSDLDDILINNVTNRIKNNTTKAITKGVLKGVGEGAEEVVSYGLNYLGDKAQDSVKNVINSDLPNMAEKLSWDDIKDNFVSGMVAGVVGGIPSTIHSAKNPDTMKFDATEGYEKNKELANAPTKEQQEKINKFFQSANTYNIDTKNDTIKTIGETLAKRNIQPIFDASAFENNNTEALWTVDRDSDGNVSLRSVIFNPNADSSKLLENVAMHELLHDIIGTKTGLKIKDIVLKNDAAKFESNLKSLEEVYSKYYDKNSPEFNSLIQEEAVASILGEKLGDQEYIKTLSKNNPALFDKIADCVVSKLNNINAKKGYKNEKLLWKDIANKVQKAYRQDYVDNTSVNSKFAFNNNIDYNNLDTDVIAQISTEPAKEKYLKYSTNPDFFKLDIKEMDRITQSISGEAELRYRNGETSGIHTDSDGTLYYYDVTNQDTYGITKVEKYTTEMEESFDETVIQKNIRNVDSNSEDGQANSIRNTSTIENRTTSQQDVRLPINNRFENNKTNTNNQESIRNRKELDNSSFSLEQRLSRDALLDAQDLIEEIKSVGGKVDKNGYVTVYHQTTSENANNILKTGKMSGKEYGIFFSTSQNATQSLERGNTKLEFKIPVENLILDDIFSDNADLKIKSKPGEKIDVSKYIVNEKNNNIKASMNSDSWQEHIDKNYKSNNKGSTLDEVKIKNTDSKEISTKKSGKDILKVTRDNNVKSIKMNDDLKTNSLNSQNNNSNDKTRKWSKTVTQAEALDQQVIEEAMRNQDYSYVPQSNKKQVDNANSIINSLGYEKSLEKHKSFMDSGKRITANDLALSQRLLQEASKRKDVKAVRELIIDNAIMGTELGQAVQSLSIVKKLSPEGQLQLLQKTVDRMKMQDPKNTSDIKITDEMVDTILSSENLEELNDNMDKIKEQLAQQMPTKFTDKIIAWRYLSMLGNPKTHIRNIVANGAMKGTMGIKNKLAASLESMLDGVIKKSGLDRTKTLKKSSKEVIDFVNNYSQDISDKLSNTSKYSMELEIKKAQKIFGDKGIGKAIQAVYDFNSNALEGEDAMFKNMAFKKAMANYLTANGIETKADIENNPNLVNNAYQYANEEALKATFQQFSSLATMLNDMKHKNKAAELALDALVPFTKTPANILKTGASYSPLGLMKSITYDTVQLKKGNINVTQYIDNISQGLTGSGIVLLGYILAQSGLISGGSEEDKEGKYEANLGKQSYSINVGNNNFTLDWLSPVSMPLFVGAEISNMKEQGSKGIDFDVATNMITTTFDPMMQMSLLQGINNALSGYKENKLQAVFEESIKSYVGQFFPTVGGQLAKTIDPTIRSTAASKDSGFTLGEQILRSNMAKVPGLTYLLEPATDIWGNEKQRSDSVVQRAIENFLSPSNRSELVETEIDSELKKVYSRTSEDKVLPKAYLNKYVNFKGEKYETDAKSYTQFKKTYGTTAYKTLENLFKTDTYKKASDQDKAKLINEAYEYAADISKKEFLQTKNVRYTNAKKDNQDIYKDNYITQVIKDDISWDAVVYREKSPTKYKLITSFGVEFESYSKYLKEVQDIKNKYPGEDNQKIRKNKIFSYINGLNISKAQKVMLFKATANYGISDYKNYLYGYINSLDLTIKDKKELWDYLYD